MISIDRPISYSFYKALFCPVKFYLLYYCNRNLKTHSMYIGTQLHDRYEFLIKEAILNNIKTLLGDCKNCTYMNDSIIPKLKQQGILHRSVPDTKPAIYFSMRLCGDNKCAILVIDNEEEVLTHE